MRSETSKSRAALTAEVRDLRARLNEAEETLRAIRNGEVDALVVAGPQGDQIFALRGAEQPYRVLIEEMNDGAATLSADGLILYANRRLTEMLGWPPERVLGTAFREFVTPIDHGALEALLQAGRSGPCGGEITGRAADGTELPWHLSVNTLPADAPAALCLIASDLSESRRMTNELRRAHDELERRVIERTTALQASERRLREAQAVAHIGSWHLDLTNDRLTWSAEVCRIFARAAAPRTYEEFLTCIHPEDRQALEQAWRDTLGGAAYDLHHRILANGAIRWVHQVAALEYNTQGDPVACLGTVQDITERKAREQEVERLTRLYATLSQINQIIVRARSREDLFQRVCDVAAKTAGFKLVWVGWLDPQTQEVAPVAHAGDDSGYLDGIKVYAHLRTKCSCPCSTCIRTGSPSVVNDLLQVEQAQPWQQVALTHDLRAAAVFPIHLGGEIRGTLSVYDREAGVFQDKEISLLAEAAMEIDYALAQLENEKLRRQAEEELVRARSTLLEAQRIAHLGSFEYVAETGTTLWSEEEYHIYGLDPAGPSPAYDEMLAKCIHPADVNLLHETFTRAMQRQAVYELDHRVVRPDGSVRWVQDRAHPYFDSQGKVIRYVGTTLDITERKQAEEALQRSESQLRTLVNTLPDLVWLKNPQGVYLSCNQRFESFFGCTVAEIIGKTDYDLVDPALADAFRANDAKAVAAGGPRMNEEEVTFASDGHHEQLETIKTPMFDGEGNLIGVLGISRNITERKRMELTLRESEARRALALDAAKAGTWEWELATGRNVWSPELWKLYGLTPHSCEPSYEAWREAVHPEDRARVEEELRVLVEQEAELRLEWRVNSSGGSPRWLMSRGRPLRDVAGRVVRYLGVVIDVTERKQIEEAARQNEQRLNFALQTSGTGAWSLNVRDHTATRTLIHAQIFGYPTAETDWSVEKFFDHVLPEDREQVRQAVSAGIAARSGWSFECRIRRTDGHVRWVFIAGGFQGAGDAAQVYGIIQDITERKRLEQDHAALEAQLRQQQKLESLGTLASGVAHEINNPINGILNYAQLIQDRLPEDSPLTEFTGEILHETQRVATIVRNLLTFARNEKQSHSPARITDIVEAVLSLMRSVIRHDQITLTVNVPADLPQLKCRSQQIQQVIMNLVTNARDALNERYPGHHPDKVLTLDAHLFATAGRRWIRLTVEDHGIGITPEVRERIFDPFFTTKGRNQGTGLGLSISHGIVKEHHGQWTVESEPGQFTRMHVDLPVDNGWSL